MLPSLRHIVLAIREWLPTQLFALGEVGAWYDPSDFSSMYQDSAGTTPVTAVEQPVGKILDKSGRGNHASQATSAARPTLSARVNLLTYSEVFSNAVWTKTRILAFGSGSVADATTAPDGTLTADKIIEDGSASTTPSVQQASTLASGTQATFRVYCKAAERTWCRVSLNANTGADASVYVNLSTGANGTSAGGTYVITSMGNGWWRIAVTGTTSTINAIPIVLVATADGGQSYSGDSTSGIYIWGASLVHADQASLPYQRIAAATDYDATVGKYALVFDGVDDALATAAIDFSAGDKMSVFAGVRKLSDAARGSIVELSNGIVTAGTFNIEAPGVATTSTYRFKSEGSITAFAGSAASFAAPITNVLTCISSISQDIATLRVNSSTIVNTVTDQGTGNYGAAYPLYIGARGGTLLPYNGHLYSLIIRAAESSASQITSAEKYVNGKTGAY